MKIKIYQLQGVDGDNIGLYITKKNYSLEGVQKLFNDAFILAKSREDAGEEINIHDEVEEFLEYLGYRRMFTENITTEIL